MSGKIQDADIKTLAELTGASPPGSASDLPHDTKIYVTANSLNEQLSSALTAGDIANKEVPLIVKEVSTPSNPPSGYIKVYSKTGDGLYTLSSGGTETQLATSAGSPLTTKGDLFGHSTVDVRIPVGTNGQYLSADSTATPGVSWKSFTAPVTTKYSGTTTATYSTPTGATRLFVEMVGAGGGGSGAGTDGGPGSNGGTGGSSSFGSSLLTCTGGSGGVAGLGGQASGGAATISSPAYGLDLPGGRGGAGNFSDTADSVFTTGGSGGQGMWGGGTPGAAQAGGAPSAGVNGGGGGGGANTTGHTTADTNRAGDGGGSGAGIKAWIPSPSSSYSVSIGAAGSGGSGGTNGNSGGDGGVGIIFVTAYFD